MKTLSRLYPVWSTSVPCAVFHGTLYSLIFTACGWSQNASDIEFFESKIRPVLAQECYECHSSSGKSKGGLVLDFRDGLLQGGDSGPALVPGKVHESLIISALKHEGDLTMPKAGVKLDPPVIADFEKWINLGAPDPRDKAPTKEELSQDTNWEAIFKTRQNWWSFQPIQNPPIPNGTTSAIDHFIQAKLAEQGLHSSPPAEARTLARRLHYAITGLPATPEALDAYEKAALENRETATGDLIDSLLASPQFGERWARHWMDWVRYAESHGSEGDPLIPNAYQYRDYLIRALNADIPYDQLLKEHVAGDLLENPRYSEAGINESAISAAHWRMVFHGFAPTDALDEKVRFTDDQINVFTKAFQGLTVSCARCHNHKFDAISQADYYALFGILGSTRPGVRLIDHPDQLAKHRESLQALKPRVKAEMAKFWLAESELIGSKMAQNKAAHLQAKKGDDFYNLFFELNKKRAVSEVVKDLRGKWNSDLAGTLKHWDLTDPKVYQSWFKYGNGLPGEPLPAGSFHIAAAGSAQVVDAILPAGIYSNDLSSKHAARLTSEDFSLGSDSTLYLHAIGGGGSRSRYVVQNYPRSGTVFKVNEMPGKGKDDSTAWKWWDFDLSYWDGDTVHIELATARDSAVLVGNADRSWFGIRQAVLAKKGGPGPQMKYTAEFLQPVAAEIGESDPNTPETLAAVFQVAFQKAIQAWADGSLSDAQAVLLDEGLRNDLLTNSFDALPGVVKDLIRDYQKMEAEIIVPTRVPGVDEWAGRDQPLYERGDHKKPLEPVSRRFIQAVDDKPYNTLLSGRTQLAADLLRDDNPFTRRVIVNRIWTHLFGSGIVASVDNFGRLGEKPSHPELLDYLAASFDTKNQWSIKSLIREIVSSATWQQSSGAGEASRQRDPENRLLSHFPVLRLEAEAIRDKLITVTGSLDPAMYGTGVNGGATRRSVYVNVIRNRLDEFLGVFDAPIPFSTTGLRPVTNVPAQSLAMLNDPMVLKYAATFSRQFSGSDDERIAAMWTRALERQPTPGELMASQDFLTRLRSTSEAVEKERIDLKSKIEALSTTNRAILAPARESLAAKAGNEKAVSADTFGAMASWDFENGTKDSVGGLDGKLTGNARIENGDLILDGNSSFFSDPLKQNLKEKTLEAVFTVGTLQQKGGGVVTVQEVDGGNFDSIVFGEKRSGEWLAGSNNFQRTKDFGGLPENEAVNRPVHLAITYDTDGTIRAYRDGVPYGNSYLSSGPHEFKAGRSQILFGLRHGTGNGGRNINGVLHEARIYSQALGADDIASLAAGKRIISTRQVLDSLSEEQRKTWQDNENEIGRLTARLSEVEKENSGVGEPAVWQNFAHSLFNLKEFIYIY